ncbi:MAG: 2-oxo acid dehydrogenase subunit E2 [Bacteroidetes bacterium]|jgi:2-oxoglutarate dehydrogenase E2 component (dihydrolipoamide succinyltransferase)|nr:2-oxo acid dehydrogenase subunit E2 [Bacteroidota bacterium]
MAEKFELIMPKMGESIAEATILRWLKKPGDQVEVDESILEIATDKVDSEVPSPVTGSVEKLLYAEGEVVGVGKAVALISVGAGGAVPAAPGPEAQLAAAVPMPDSMKEAQPSPANALAPMAEARVEVVAMDTTLSGRFYSPLVLSIARTEGIAMNELELVPGTGNEGRVTKKDILAYVKNRTVAPVLATVPQAAPGKSAAQSAGGGHGFKVDVPMYPGDEIVEMDRMRRLIADHMVMSKHVSPHVTSFVEADVTRIWLWREKMKKQVEQRFGEKLTFTPIFIEAIVKAIKELPGVNVSVTHDLKVVKRGDINIGMATALPSGNLIVPVIKKADELSLLGLTKKVNDLANRARANKLSPDDIQGGTYTITNVGTFGNVMGTPIINQPQVAIMATGAIQKKPAVIETPEGDVIGIRYKMFLSHSYDHRIVDGALGGMFVRKVADILESWDMGREV